MVLAPIEQIRHVPCQHREVVRRIDAGIHIPQEPLIHPHEFLLDIPVDRVPFSISIRWTKHIHSRGVDIIRLVQFPFRVWQSHHNSQILPNITSSQLQRLPHLLRRTQPCTRGISTLYTQHALAFQAVEVLGEAAAVGSKVVSFYS